MGASTGMFGTVRSQNHLLQVLVYTDNPVVNTPQVLVMTAKDKFDANLHLTDEATRGFVRDLLKNLVTLVHVYRAQSQPAGVERRKFRTTVGCVGTRGIASAGSNLTPSPSPGGEGRQT